MTRLMVLGFLTDNNVPDSAGNALADAGHTVVRQRETMATTASDPVLAVAAIQAGLILLSWDKDFNHQRFQAPRFLGLSRIGMSCPEFDGAKRLAETIDLVEFAFRRAAGTPLTILIGQKKVLIRA